MLLLSCAAAVLCEQRPDTDTRISLDPLYGKTKIFYVGNQQTVNLTCNPIKTKANGFNWTHNGNMITEQHENYDVTYETGELFISRVSPKYLGAYNCLLNTDVGNLISETVTLKLAETDAVLGEIIIPTRESIDQLPCDVMNHSVPAGKVTWRRKGEKINSGENVHIDLEGTLIFLYKKSGDFYKYYQCFVHNDVLDVTLAGNRTSLGGSRDRQQTDPSLVSSTEPVVGIEGYDVTMECVYKGDPAPVITWKNSYGYQLTQSEKHSFPSIQGRQLRINDLTKSDEGSYSCSARNTVGFVTSNVHLTVRKMPGVLEPLVSRTVLTGSNVTYSCKPLDPTHKVTWFINGRQAQTGNEKYEISRGSQDITVISTLSLCVQCQIINDDVFTLYSGCVRYVDSEDQLPTRNPAVTPDASESKPVTPYQQSTVSRYVVPAIVGVSIGSIIIIIIVIIIVIIIAVRKRRRRVKKRLSTVGTSLPDRPSIVLRVSDTDD